MAADNSNNALIVVWAVCLFVFFLFSLISLRSAIPMVKNLLWKSNTSKHVDIQAEIIDCKVKEVERLSTNPQSGSTVYIKIYYPVVTVQYEYNGRKFTPDIPLHIEGYGLPDSAFSTLAQVAPMKKVRYIQTSTKKIGYEVGEILSSIRVHNDDQKTYTMQVTINKDNPALTNYNFDKNSLSDWILTAVFLLMGITPAILFFAFVKQLPFSTKLNTLLITLFILYLSVHGIPFLLNKLNIRFVTPATSTPALEILIDDSYDGSQLKPYLETDLPEEN